MKKKYIDLSPEIYDLYERLVAENCHKIFVRNPKSLEREQIYKVLLLRCHEKKTLIQCGRKLKKDSIRIIHTGLVKAIHEMELDDVFTYTRDRIRHQNGSEIVFSGIRKRGRFRLFDRIDADIFYGEDSHEYSESSFFDLEISVMKVLGVLIYTGNTETKRNYFWKYSEIFRQVTKTTSHIIDIP